MQDSGRLMNRYQAEILPNMKFQDNLQASHRAFHKQTLTLMQPTDHTQIFPAFTRVQVHVYSALCNFITRCRQCIYHHSSQTKQLYHHKDPWHCPFITTSIAFTPSGSIAHQFSSVQSLSHVRLFATIQTLSCSP